MPIIVLFLLMLVQVVVIVRDQVAVIHAAREGARAAAVSSAPVAAGARAARSGAGIAPVSVDSVVGGGHVTVTVAFLEHTDVPLIGAFVPDVVLTGRVTMQLEPS